MILLMIGIISLIIIIFTFLKPRLALFVFLFVLMAFNDYVGGIQSSIIEIGGRLFYAADFFHVLFVVALIRLFFHRELTSRIDRPVFIIMLIFTMYGVVGMILGAANDSLYKDIIGDLRRYFYYIWAIFIPMILLRDRKDIHAIEKVAFSAAPIICIFALYRIITGQTYLPAVHAFEYDNFRAMGHHDYIVLIFVICLSIGKIIQNKENRNLLAKAYILILPPFVIASNFRIALILLVICPGIVLYMFRSGRISLKPLRKIAFFGLLGVVLLGVTAKTTGNKVYLQLEARFSSGVMSFTFNESDRDLMWEEAISEWKISPLLGCGLGKKIFIKERSQAAALHNSYLEILLKGGIIGLILFFTLQLILITRILKLFKRTEIYKPFVAAGIAYIFAGLVQTGIQPFFTEPNSIVLIYLIIGTVISLQSQKVKMELRGYGI
jgi:O-antigen ligase